MDHGKIEKGVRLILAGLGCDTKDRNFMETPDRFARAMAEMFDPPDIEYPTFEEQYSDFVLLKGHVIFTLCPHHLLPAEFTIDLAYIPDGEVLGLSKMARMLQDINRGPLLQEKFTRDITQKMREVLPKVKGVACIVSGKHGCARIRGIKTCANFLTYNFTGAFKDAANEQRFFELTRR